MPDEFRPSRWYGVSDPDVAMFGSGPRACVGRKFAITESINFLSHLLADWRLDVELKGGETRMEYTKRVMSNAGPEGTAFSIKDVSVRLIRRSK